MARTIKNCSVIKEALDLGEGVPLTEIVDNKVYCQGYQRHAEDDEPYEKCKNCYLSISKFNGQ